ncbi:MAG: heme-binding protein [Spirochaetaceae bacterium]|nr:heme-binding protein [Spirochaetaceae bacterium]
MRLLQRFGDAILLSLEISPKKADTAAVLRQSTAEFGKIAQVGGSAFGINVTNDKLVIFGGGFPLQVKGKTVGGIGVSGGSVAEDEAVAHAVLEAFAELTR